MWRDAPDHVWLDRCGCVGVHSGHRSGSKGCGRRPSGPLGRVLRIHRRGLCPPPAASSNPAACSHQVRTTRQLTVCHVTSLYAARPTLHRIPSRLPQNQPTGQTTNQEHPTSVQTAIPNSPSQTQSNGACMLHSAVGPYQLNKRGGWHGSGSLAL